MVFTLCKKLKFQFDSSDIFNNPKKWKANKSILKIYKCSIYKNIKKKSIWFNTENILSNDVIR